MSRPGLSGIRNTLLLTRIGAHNRARSAGSSTGGGSGNGDPGAVCLLDCLRTFQVLWHLRAQVLLLRVASECLMQEWRADSDAGKKNGPQ